jgi:hypothetical protein
MKGSHCIRMKRVKTARGIAKRCVAFSGGRGKGRKGRKGGKRRKGRRGLGDPVGGFVSACTRYKKVRGKRGKVVTRCARFSHGPGYPSVPFRKSAGIRRPVSQRALAKRERKARIARAAKNARFYRPRMAA